MPGLHHQHAYLPCFPSYRGMALAPLPHTACVFLLFTFKKWNGSFFEKSSLRDSGLCIQLGHGGGNCIAPTPGPTTFIVVDVSGIQNVVIH
jgi:hypothetical protein